MNIIEYLRKQIVLQLDDTVFKKCFPTWKNVFEKYAPNKTEMQIFNLGDHLSEAFSSTKTNRDQGGVSAGGSAWEALVCWYLNLCLIGRRTIVIKHNKDFIPTPVSDSFTVNYQSFKSNTESDIIAITFPDRPEYKCDMDAINIKDINGDTVPLYVRGTYNHLGVLNALSHRDFNQLEIYIIQTKTNWNDNSQIPMLWDAVYSATSFKNDISVGTNGYSIHDVKKFKYCFVTVPTNKLSLYKTTSTCVLRVNKLSGGNFWGYPTKQGIASSIKEILDRNLKAGSSDSIISSIRKAVPELSTTYYYFGL